MCPPLGSPVQLYAACSDIGCSLFKMLPWPVVLAMVLQQLMAAAGWLSSDAGQQVPPNTPGMPHTASAGAREPHPSVHGVGGVGRHAHAGQAPTPAGPTPVQQQHAAGRCKRTHMKPAATIAAAAAARRQATQRVLVYALSQWSPLLLKACGLSKQCPQWPPEQPLISNPGPVVAVLLQAVPAIAASLQRAAAAAAAPLPEAQADPQAASSSGTAVGSRESTGTAGADAGAAASSSSSSMGDSSGERREGSAGAAAHAATAIDAASWRALLLHGMRALRLVGHELDGLHAGTDDDANAAAAHFGRLHEPLVTALHALLAAVPRDVAAFRAQALSSFAQAAVTMAVTPRGWIILSAARAALSCVDSEWVSWARAC